MPGNTRERVPALFERYCSDIKSLHVYALKAKKTRVIRACFFACQRTMFQVWLKPVYRVVAVVVWGQLCHRGVGVVAAFRLP
ncbi:MAG: hypothetical protein K0Q77_1922 [Anaerosporomusa subterranea]|nr:hypothetical protein [Anaerosporomusa subterranea]